MGDDQNGVNFLFLAILVSKCSVALIWTLDTAQLPWVCLQSDSGQSLYRLGPGGVYRTLDNVYTLTRVQMLRLRSAL